MVCLDTLTIWYNGGSGTYETPIQNPPCTRTTVREVLSQTTLSLDNCYSTSRSGDPLDLDGTWFNEVGFEPNPTIYKISCPEPVKPLYSHGHIDTLHMRHIQETIKDYSAMRGPCPEGFHIPMAGYSGGHRCDFTSLLTPIVSALGLSVTTKNMEIYFKLPLAGERLPSGSIYKRGESGYYWCTYGGGYTARTYLLHSPTTPNASGNCNEAKSIRPFKDKPVAPDNTRTTLYDGSAVATNAGIFRNQAEGIISASSDGTTWVTIADKNVGATTVYNLGDTLSEANCGKYFQFGNNYGFPFSGSVTISTTVVDASGYGPGNYYYGEELINGAPQLWDSSRNRNLRGYETGTKTVTIDRREPVYYGPQPTLWTEAEILNATDLDTLMAELNAHPEEYHDMLLDGENCRLDNPCTSDSFIIMYKSSYNYYKICGVYINYTTYNNKWNWETSACPL